MSNGRRSRLERFIDILRIVEVFGPIKQTQIMYRTNINWNQLKPYLLKLNVLDLIDQRTTNEGVVYDINNEGKRVLEHYEKVTSDLGFGYSDFGIESKRV